MALFRPVKAVFSFYLSSRPPVTTSVCLGGQIGSVCDMNNVCSRLSMCAPALTQTHTCTVVCPIQRADLCVCWAWAHKRPFFSSVSQHLWENPWTSALQQHFCSLYPAPAVTAALWRHNSINNIYWKQTVPLVRPVRAFTSCFDCGRWCEVLKGNHFQFLGNLLSILRNEQILWCEIETMITLDEPRCCTKWCLFPCVCSSQRDSLVSTRPDILMPIMAVYLSLLMFGK